MFKFKNAGLNGIILEVAMEISDSEVLESASRENERKVKLSELSEDEMADIRYTLAASRLGFMVM